MAQVVPDASEANILTRWLLEATPWTLRLFSNNKMPAAGDVFADYDEVAGGGYVAMQLWVSVGPYEGWTVTPGAPSVAAHPQVALVFIGATDAPGTVYGWCLTDASGIIVGGDRLPVTVDTPGGVFTPLYNGDRILLVPRVTLASRTGN